MKASIDWINTYLSSPIARDEAINALKQAGFPEDGCETVSLSNGGSAEWIDFEVTSNRGDVLSHTGLARELSAVTDRSLVLPVAATSDTASGSIADYVSLDIQAPDACPLYTARVIKGVKVGPSPDWLVERLESVGQRSINNVVDITNFVLLEYGQPLHAFDLGKIPGGKIVVRYAADGEPMKTLDGQTHKLKPEMLVIANGQAPVALAGVMGGHDSEVTDATTDILLESAIFAPLVVRTASRRLKLATDSSFRFERGACPWRVEMASLRAMQLILELAGGQAVEGVIEAGPGVAAPKPITLRLNRCRQIFGIPIDDQAICDCLSRLGLSPQPNGDAVVCTPPSFRLDLKREIDLIEEVARVHGLHQIPVQDTLRLRARPPQDAVKAKQRLHAVYSAHGYQEAVTYSFVPESSGQLFVDASAKPVMIADERRKQEPMLRPSALPSLLACRKLNQDVGNHNVRLYEIGSAWQQQGEDRVETVQLAWIADGQPKTMDSALRQVRGLATDCLQRLGKAEAVAKMTVEPTEAAGFDTAARVLVDGQAVGVYGVLSQAVLDTFDLQTPVVAGTLVLEALLPLYPPAPGLRALPRFPGIERDLSIVVEETVTWAQIQETIQGTSPALLVDLGFVGIYRGKPIVKGQKSVTLRMVFRDDARTLRHEEVDPQVASVVSALAEKLQAQLRG